MKRRGERSDNRQFTGVRRQTDGQMDGPVPFTGSVQTTLAVWSRKYVWLVPCIWWLQRCLPPYMQPSRIGMSVSWNSHPAEDYTAQKRTQLRRTPQGAERPVAQSTFIQINTNKTAMECWVRRTVAKGDRL